MKKTSLVLAFFLTLTLPTALAAPAPKSKIGFKCVSTMPTSSFVLREEGAEAVLTLVHHNGTGYMPIHEGVIVPNDLPLLSEAASVLTKMGERVVFRFPLERCKVHQRGIVSCVGGNTLTFDGVEMQALSFETSKIKEEFSAGVYTRNRVSLLLLVSGLVPVKEISMNYYEGECRFD